MRQPQNSAELAVDPIVADAVRSPQLDRILLVPRNGVDPHLVISIVEEACGRRPRRESIGIPLKLADALALYRSRRGEEVKWTHGVARYLQNRASIQTRHQAVLKELAYVRSALRADAATRLHPDLEIAHLDDHQVVNVAAMTIPDSPGLCLFDEQGAGKTVSLIFAFDELVRRDEVDFALIVAPKSMVGEWPKDFSRFMGDLYRVVCATGGSHQKRAALRSKPEVLITNYETAHTLESELEAFLRSFSGRSVIVVDESFFIKSPHAQRTTALRRLREWCGRAYVLCGTPAPNSPIDLVEQFNFVDFGATFGDTELPDDRVAALPVVQGLIEVGGLYVRNLKQDVLPDLPSKSFERVLMDLAPQQESLYRTALQALARDLSSTSDEQFNRRITNFLAQRSALLQLCSDPAAVADGYNELPCKILALDELLARLVRDQDEKVIIWSFYKRSIDRLCDRYREYGIVRYDGTISSVTERRTAVSRFQEDDNIKVMIANPAAAGAGLTLHRSRYAIYESLSNQAAHYLQSLDRIHRRGQTREVKYFVLLAKGTIETVEYDRVLTKEAAAQALLGDVVAPAATRISMLEEALALIRALDVQRQ